MAWSTPRTWVAGEIVKASYWNAYRDQLKALAPVGGGAWTAFASAWTGSGSNPTYATTVSRFCQRGRLVVWRARFTYTSGGTGTWYFSTPLPIAAYSSEAFASHGWGYVQDVSGDDTYNYHPQNRNVQEGIELIGDGQTFAGVLSQTSPFTFASPDPLTFIMVYETG